MQEKLAITASLRVVVVVPCRNTPFVTAHVDKQQLAAWTFALRSCTLCANVCNKSHFKRQDYMHLCCRSPLYL